MKRLLAVASLFGLMAAAAPADAQDRIASRFDLAVYAGGTWSSPWHSYEDLDFTIESSPIFGTHGTYWFSEKFGTRLHGAYWPAQPPQTNTIPANAWRETWGVNNWMADLNLVFRPWWGGDGIGSTAYLWLGGGMLRTNVAGTGTECRPDYLPYEGCLSMNPDYATVGQGTLGLGVDLFSITSSLDFFAELGAHLYDSPMHSTGEVGEDRFVVTPKLVGGFKLGLGEILPPVVPIPPAPPPPPPPPPPPAERQIQVCVVQNGALQNITASFRPATNDTVIGNTPFSQAHPATTPNYAAAANWFVQESEMTFQNAQWVKFGVTRVVPATQLQRVGEVNGVSVFAETGTQAPYPVVYVPVRPGCEFQPYQQRETIRPRG